MRTLAIVLAHLASTSHGYLQEVNTPWSQANEQVGAVRPLKVLAAILMNFNYPSVGWPNSGQLPSRSLVRGTSHTAKRERSSCVVLLAKKKAKKGNKGKKGKAQKQSFADMLNFELKPTDNDTLIELAEGVVSSYSARTGRSGSESLLRAFQTPSNIAKALWEAPVAVMVVKEAPPSGDSEHSTGNIVYYANLAALEAHGLKSNDYKTFFDSPIELPLIGGDKKYESGYSKKLAVGGKVLADVDGKEASTDASVSKITLLEAERWVMEKMAVVDGKLTNEQIGTAYAWDSWELPNGMLCKPGVEPFDKPEVKRKKLEASLEEVGKVIRKLKEEDGKGNKDPEVMEQVVVLKELKAQLAEMDEE